MRLEILSEDEMYAEVDEHGKSLVAVSPAEEPEFQTEIKDLYFKLLRWLSLFGKEGSNYEECDFAIRPHPKGLAPLSSLFVITIISEKFLRSDYLTALRRFNVEQARAYCFWIGQDSDPEWRLDIFLYSDAAKVFCDRSSELKRIRDVLERL